MGIGVKPHSRSATLGTDANKMDLKITIKFPFVIARSMD
ncbi:hypothetical protein SAMN02746065_10321 [Desulfocicer vacuolatum DSM 3385]|uniref:Uncharacterized protein n=1 Tax=Desulfocicer vacuolatum DSM 3385 TaxID=1121400 RepID=A0A1W1ZLG0_9BACT|nr:hypothetical protein SAMN02746065_10321 [Desulfocicer vacuolatum DSM 3385]